MNRNHEIRLTELDAARLERSLVEQLRRENAPTQGTAELEALLDEAAVVPAASIDPQVVTMNSTVVVEEVPSRTRKTLTVAYPNEADAERARVSVLSPVGRALIGARVGDIVEVAVPNHATRQLLVAELTYQPEANGHLDV